MVQRLKQLALEHFATSPAELKRYARGQGIPHTGKDVVEALKTNAALQVFAPKARFASVSAAERPGSRIQADLAEFPATKENPNPKHKYALVATDVYTRQTYAEPLENKTAKVTNAAMAKVLDKMPDHARNAALTTDGGQEFSGLETLKDRETIHRLKVGRNDISIVDRSLQTLKAKLANARANHGGSWDSSLQKVVTSYNENPRAAVHGAPINADQPDAQGFAVLQDNAERFQHNFDVALARKKDVAEAGAVRPAISDGSRQHKPRYGPVAQIASTEPGGLHAVDAKGNRILLKTAQVVDKTTTEPKAVFGTRERKRIGMTPAEIQARLKRARRSMVGPIPKAASNAFGQEEAPAPSAPSGIAHPVAASLRPVLSAAEKSAYLRARFVGGEAKRTPEEQALYKANAARKKAELEAAQKKREDDRKAREKAKDDEKAAKQAAREAAKALKPRKK